MTAQGFSRRTMLAGLGAFAASSAVTAPARAQAWPSRPIKMIVPYPPGGAPDIMVRILNNHLSTALGVPLIVDNRPGGSTTIGAVATTRSDPDGYTLMIASTTTMSVVPTMQGARTPYDPEKGFTPICLVSRAPFFFMVSAASGFGDLKSVIAQAKAKPGSVTYGSNGLGGTSHIGTLLFQKETGTEMVHVPYKSISMAATDIVSGQINLLLGDLSTVAGLVDDKRIKLVASASAQRSPLAADIPTLSEAVGVDLGDLGPWFGIIGPANLPTEMVTRLNADIRSFVASPAAQTTYSKIAQLPLSSSPGEFAQLIRSDTERFAAIIRDNKLSLE